MSGIWEVACCVGAEEPEDAAAFLEAARESDGVSAGFTAGVSLGIAFFSS